MEYLDCIDFSIMALFTDISAMCYSYTIVYMEHMISINRLPALSYNFILIEVVKLSVSTSKFYVFDI